jgi:hypothetical protein
VISRNSTSAADTSSSMYYSRALPSSFIAEEPDHFSHKEWHHHITKTQYLHHPIRTSAFPNLIPWTIDKQLEPFRSCFCSASFYIGFDSESIPKSAYASALTSASTSTSVYTPVSTSGSSAPDTKSLMASSSAAQATTAQTSTMMTAETG